MIQILSRAMILAALARAVWWFSASQAVDAFDAVPAPIAAIATVKVGA